MPGLLVSMPSGNAGGSVVFPRAKSWFSSCLSPTDRQYRSVLFTKSSALVSCIEYLVLRVHGMAIADSCGRLSSAMLIFRAGSDPGAGLPCCCHPNLCIDRCEASMSSGSEHIAAHRRASSTCSAVLHRECKELVPMLWQGNIAGLWIRVLPNH
jgi:hypothetical protein